MRGEGGGIMGRPGYKKGIMGYPELQKHNGVTVVNKFYTEPNRSGYDPKKQNKRKY